MATYILLVNWTDQGIKAIKDSPKRLDAGRALAKKFGCEVKDFYLTFGPYDMISVVEAPTTRRWPSICSRSDRAAISAP